MIFVLWKISRITLDNVSLKEASKHFSLRWMSKLHTNTEGKISSKKVAGLKNFYFCFLHHQLPLNVAAETICNLMELTTWKRESFTSSWIHFGAMSITLIDRRVLNSLKCHTKNPWRKFSGEFLRRRRNIDFMMPHWPFSEILREIN